MLEPITPPSNERSWRVLSVKKRVDQRKTHNALWSLLWGSMANRPTGDRFELSGGSPALRRANRGTRPLIHAGWYFKMPDLGVKTGAEFLQPLYVRLFHL